MFAIMAVPQTLLMVAALLAELPVGEQLTGWAGGLLMSALLAVLLAAFGLAVATLTPRRGVGVAAIITILLVGQGFSFTLSGLAAEQDLTDLAAVAGALDPYRIIDGLSSWVLGVDAAIGEFAPTAAWQAGVLALAWLLGVLRLRRVPAPSLPERGAAVTTIVLESVSRWYGNVVAVNDVSITVGPGITGLLGPNGAGKSTLISMMGGFLAPSTGTVTLDGGPVWRNPEIYRTIGLVPEPEAMYDMVTGRQFLLANARLHGLADAGAAARRALEAVDMVEPSDRPIATYSKGMKQRIKMATALVHDPSVLLLDEPFNGMDPRQRLHLMDLLTRLAAEGRTVLFSSHILEEVEQIAGTIEVMVAGRHAASGDYRRIRRLMTERPHQYTIASSDDRRLAGALIAAGAADGVTVGGGALAVQTSDWGRFVHALPRVAREAGVRLLEVSPADESLESVFAYLVAR